MAASFTPREVPIYSIGKKNNEASATISKGMACKLDTAADDGIKKCSATTDPAIGIAREDIVVGTWGGVLVLGTAVCLAGGMVHRGDKVSPDSASKVATTTTNKDRVLGIANREAVVGELFEVLLGVGATLSA